MGAGDPFQLDHIHETQQTIHLRGVLEIHVVTPRVTVLRAKKITGKQPAGAQ